MHLACDLAMLPTLLIALFSLTLLLVARRGRRIDDHPLCRNCRFDLTGLPATSCNCPECGRDIRSPHSTLPGHRQPIRSLLLTAWLVLVPTSLLFAALVALRITHISLIRFEPLVLLNASLTTPATSASTDALREITRRLDARALSAADLIPTVDKILRLQADTSRPWDPSLGDLVLDAATHSLLDPTRWQTFLSQSVEVTASASPAVHQHANPTLWISPALTRTCHPRLPALPEIALSLDTTFNGIAKHGASKSSGWGGGSTGVHILTDPNPPPLPLGTQHASLDYRLSIAFPWVPLGAGVVHGSRTISFSIIPDDISFVSANHAPAMQAAFAKAITLRDSTIRLRSAGAGLHAVFHLHPTPIPAHFLVQLVQDQNHWNFQVPINISPETSDEFDGMDVWPGELKALAPHPGPAEILLTPRDLNPDEQPLDPFTHLPITELFAEPLHLPITLTR